MDSAYLTMHELFFFFFFRFQLFFSFSFIVELFWCYTKLSLVVFLGDELFFSFVHYLENKKANIYVLFFLFIYQFDAELSCIFVFNSSYIQLTPGVTLAFGFCSVFLINS